MHRLLFAVALLLPAALHAQAATRDETRRAITIRYGIVDTITQARMQSEAAGNAVVGGVLGAAMTHDRRDRGRNAAIGALAGALLTKASEGRHRVDEITVRLADGSELKVLQDHTDGLAKGGCVSVEQGAHTNVRAVSAEHCAAAPIHQDSAVASRRQGEADACELAKEELARAQNEQQFDFASRKIRALCH